jgi:hypothetical protein
MVVAFFIKTAELLWQVINGKKERKKESVPVFLIRPNNETGSK